MFHSKYILNYWVLFLINQTIPLFKQHDLSPFLLTKSDIWCSHEIPLGQTLTNHVTSYPPSAHLACAKASLIWDKRQPSCNSFTARHFCSKKSHLRVFLKIILAFSPAPKTWESSRINTQRRQVTPVTLIQNQVSYSSKFNKAILWEALWFPPEIYTCVPICLVSWLI